MCSSPGEVSTSELSPGSTLRHQITTLSRHTYLDTAPTLYLPRHPDITPTPQCQPTYNRHSVRHSDTSRDTSVRPVSKAILTVELLGQSQAILTALLGQCQAVSMVSRQNRHSDRLTISAIYMRAKGVGSGELRAVAELWVILMVNGVTLIVWDGRCGRVGFAPAIAGSACDATVDCRIRCCSVRNGWFERSGGIY